MAQASRRFPWASGRTGLAQQLDLLGRSKSDISRSCELDYGLDDFAGSLRRLDLPQCEGGDAELHGCPDLRRARRLIAALDASSCRADSTDAFANLIGLAASEAARRTEAELFREAFAKARIVLTPPTEAHGGGLLAIDGNDLIIGATRSAQLALGLTLDHALRPIPAAELLCGLEGSRGSSVAQRAALLRALTRTQGNVSVAAKALGVSRATLHQKLKGFDLKAH